jgi:EAL domain-containing protein (putative c-di-GMP-specific phosphodiesterase class I)/ActR/RegA family two-component response regulator
MRLLVFDDDEALGRLVARVADIAGLQATAVSEAEPFRQALRTEKPDVVVLDLQLGPTDGVEQVRYLADQDYRGSLVLMSGFDARVLETAGALARGLRLSVEAVLQKPVHVQELEQLLRKLRLRQPTPDSLRAAIVHGQLVLEFQPVVTRQPRRLRLLESLVRWDHPELGRLNPAEFVAMAESDPAAIDALTDWVLQHAIAAWARLESAGVRVPFAVNVSSHNLLDQSLPDRVDGWLRQAGMPAEMLCLEVTEGAAFNDPNLTMAVLSRLRLKGVQVALDDFGTGYASLRLLRQMPFGVIKIDQSFVQDMLESRDSDTIVKCIVDLARNMDMESIAEGVESEAVALRLEQMQVSALQGHLIAPAMPVERVADWLRAWTAAERATA